MHADNMRLHYVCVYLFNYNVRQGQGQGQAHGIRASYSPPLHINRPVRLPVHHPLLAYLVVSHNFACIDGATTAEQIVQLTICHILW